jgi:hypothetical protein
MDEIQQALTANGIISQSTPFLSFPFKKNGNEYTCQINPTYNKDGSLKVSVNFTHV